MYGDTPIISIEELFEHAKDIAFEKYVHSESLEYLLFSLFRYECPACKMSFLSRLECTTHIATSHPEMQTNRLYCEICHRTFTDKKTREQHDSYHKRVQLMIEHREVEVGESLWILNGSISSGHRSRDTPAAIL